MGPTTRAQIFVGLCGLAACKPEEGPAAVPVPSGSARMVGSWRQEKELGESEDRVEGKRTILTIKSDGTLRYLFPASGADKEVVMDFKYQLITTAGKTMLMKMTLVTKDGELAGDDKKFTLVNENTLEERGVANGKETGLGGLFKRFEPGAAPPKAPEPPRTEVAKVEPPKPTPPVDELLCKKASKCCHVVAGNKSAACDNLLKAASQTGASSLDSFRKAVKKSKPRKLAMCD